VKTDKVLEKSQNSGPVTGKLFREESSRQACGDPDETEISDNK